MTDIREEALRYLGVRGEADEQTSALLERGERALNAAASPAFCWRAEKKAEREDLLIGNDIREHLKDSATVLFFAATLGAGADRLIRAAEVENMAYALVLDALSSAMIERYCDECEEVMREKTGGRFTFRFSPGYGDFPIELQGALLRFLSAEKRIGLTATENHILIPRKSVTAVIGIIAGKGEGGEPPRKKTCESCNMRDRCDFRRCGNGEKMILYHGSPIGGLSELKPFLSEHQKPYLYFAENPLVALLYAAKPVPKPFSFYPYGFGENGELLYSEYYENAFFDLYHGKRGYLYECRVDRERLETPARIRGVYTCAETVKVESGSEISDLYAYYRERETTGAFRIRTRGEISEKEMDFVREEMSGYMREYGLKRLPDHEMSGFIRTRFPEVWGKEQTD